MNWWTGVATPHSRPRRTTAPAQLLQLGGPAVGDVAMHRWDGAGGEAVEEGQRARDCAVRQANPTGRGHRGGFLHRAAQKLAGGRDGAHPAEGHPRHRAHARSRGPLGGACARARPRCRRRPRRTPPGPAPALPPGGRSGRFRRPPRSPITITGSMPVCRMRPGSTSSHRMRVRPPATRLRRQRPFQLGGRLHPVLERDHDRAGPHRRPQRPAGRLDLPGLGGDQRGVRPSRATRGRRWRLTRSRATSPAMLSTRRPPDRNAAS